MTDIKVNLETVKGNIKALDTKVEQLDKRVANQEFLNRGVFIGLLLALLGGAGKSARLDAQATKLILTYLRLFSN